MLLLSNTDEHLLTFEVTHGHQSGRYSIRCISLPISGLYSIITTSLCLHSFRDITISSMYVTASDFRSFTVSAIQLKLRLAIHSMLSGSYVKYCS